MMLLVLKHVDSSHIATKISRIENVEVTSSSLCTVMKRCFVMTCQYG
jgi:hypothetical protein